MSKFIGIFVLLVFSACAHQAELQQKAYGKWTPDAKSNGFEREFSLVDGYEFPIVKDSSEVVYWLDVESGVFVFQGKKYYSEPPDCECVNILQLITLQERIEDLKLILANIEKVSDLNQSGLTNTQRMKKILEVVLEENREFREVFKDR